MEGLEEAVELWEETGDENQHTDRLASEVVVVVDAEAEVLELSEVTAKGWAVVGRLEAAAPSEVLLGGAAPSEGLLALLVVVAVEREDSAFAKVAPSEDAQEVAPSEDARQLQVLAEREELVPL